MNEDEAFTPQEVADQLRIAKNTVYELIRRGELPSYRVGKKMRIDRKDVEAYKNKGRGRSLNKDDLSLGGLKLGSVAESSASPPLAFAETPGLPSLVLSGQDLVLDILARRIELRVPGLRVYRSYLGSYNGVCALYLGTVHAAGAHLWDGKTDSYNVTQLPHLLPGCSLVAVHLACRRVGYYVAKGNPKGLKDWNDLKRSDLSMINREKGSGMRILLDERLRILGLDGSDIPGYSRECSNHLAAASLIARGGADFSLGNEKVSRQVKEIDFLPLQTERYDLVFLRKNAEHEGFKALVEIAESKDFKEELEGLGDYDLRDTGRQYSL